MNCRVFYVLIFGVECWYREEKKLMFKYINFGMGNMLNN